MKKIVSVNLEQDLINIIDDFQKSKNLSSRSAALERILLYYQFITTNIVQLNNTQKYLEETESEPEKDDKTKNSIDDILNQMPK